MNNKKYSYCLRFSGKNTTLIQCEAAKVNQTFLNEDIPALLIDLPNLILAEIEYNKKQEEIIRFRVNSEEKKAIEKKAIEQGYSNTSAFLRDLALNK